MFTGGLTTEADFGTEVLRITATDPDVDLNAKLSYYIRKPVHSTLLTRNGQEEQIGVNPFVIDRDTGIISLNFDPQRDMKGYFDMEVRFGFTFLNFKTNCKKMFCSRFTSMTRADTMTQPACLFIFYVKTSGSSSS